MGNFLKVITTEQVAALTVLRTGETKLGEKVQVAPDEDWVHALAQSNARYVLLGIPEDIGVRANLGVGGTQHTWLPALKAILNLQHTPVLNGERLFLLGAFDFSEWLADLEGTTDINRLREKVAQIDEVVGPVIKSIVRAGKIPLVIGGGHNNAYPIIKGVSEALERAINCINLDAHSDYRVMEGRHSGNGFRYAHAEGLLNRYAMVGLHRNYNSASVVADLEQRPDSHFSFYEDIFLYGQMNFEHAVADAVRFTEDAPTGIEIDIDCIEHALSSATTPCGVSSLQARRYITLCRRTADVAYLHVAEGAVQLADGRISASTAKLIAYIISDFIRDQPL